MDKLPNSHNAFRRVKGVSLLIVLVMMVIIGLTAVSAMRSATSSQMAMNNLRMDGLAQQYAEAALRYCEGQLQLPDAARVATLRAAVIPATTTAAVSGWELPATWTEVPGSGVATSASPTRTTVPDANISTVGITTIPTKRPECVVETQTQAGASPTFTVTLVTSRGFSPDYSADANGVTVSGAVVWLQSILNL